MHHPHESSSRKLRFKTIFISDVHLGSPHCHVEKVLDFLSHTECQQLILNGDFIDGWSLKRKGGWTHRCTRCIRLLLSKASNGTDVIYVRGNHDDFLDFFLELNLSSVRVCNSYEHNTREGRYLVVHGDGFDSVTSQHKWLAVLGDIAYQATMNLNLLYNRIREKRGLPYRSFSRWVKSKVKSAVAFVDKYEEQLQHLARQHNHRGIICGHIHTPADKQLGDMHYLNSGDWVESLTALVEHYDGGFEVITYDQFIEYREDAMGTDPAMLPSAAGRELRDPDCAASSF